MTWVESVYLGATSEKELLTRQGLEYAVVFDIR